MSTQAIGVSTKRKVWPWVLAVLLASSAWTVFVMYRSYHHWVATGLEEPMGGTIRNGVIAIVALAGALFVGMKATSTSSHDASRQPSSSSELSAAHGAEATGLLANLGSKYVLEVRGLGVSVNTSADEEIWQKIREKNDNFSPILSTRVEDYPSDSDTRMMNLELMNGLAFKNAAGRAVQYWPIPVIIWGPPRAATNSLRPATNIADNRQKASLGVSLFLWQEDASTNDSPAMIQKLFDFFDAHPDVPEAVVFSFDGITMRELLKAPGSGILPKGRFIPEIPDSVVGILVSRSDRVDRLIRPFAVEQHGHLNQDTTQYDVTRLWNFYWEKNDGAGPDDFDAFYRSEGKRLGFPADIDVGTMSASWWQKQLPTLWKQIGNKGPGEFKPTPYIPVRWTNWQVKQFDSAPVIGYLHRPIDVKLTDSEGKPLSKTAQIAALRSGWTAAVDTLPQAEQPKRVFYDTTGDRTWAIPITQALSQAGEGAPDLADVKQGYDIGRRIGNTGISSPMVQLGLGLIAGYKEGGTSATINRRPDGNATIMMVSPPDAATKAAWVSGNGGKDLF